MSAEPAREGAPAALLLRRLEQFAELTEADRALLPAAGTIQQTHEIGTELAREGGPPGLPRLLVSGWACRMRVLPDGRRQILTLLLPGDCVGLSAAPPVASRALWTTMALGRISTVGIERLAAALRSGKPEHAAVASACAAIATLEQAQLLDHIVSLGHRTAIERVAHLLLELRDRLAAVGIGQGNWFPCPLTQEVMADLLGLSTVHVNRTLQQLRRERLLILQSGQAELPDAEILAGIANYERPGVAAGLCIAAREPA